MESMDSDIDRVVVSLNLEVVVNKYNTWNHFTESKLKSSLTFLKVNLLHIIYIYLNVCKQMTDVKLLLLRCNSRNHLILCKQMRKSIYFSSFVCTELFVRAKNTWNHSTLKKKNELKCAQKFY